MAAFVRVGAVVLLVVGVIAIFTGEPVFGLLLAMTGLIAADTPRYSPRIRTAASVGVGRLIVPARRAAKSTVCRALTRRRSRGTRSEPLDASADTVATWPP